MMYTYVTLPDDTLITHSHLIVEGDRQYVKVHFECPVEGGFKSARCVLPEYRWEFNEGYTDAEINFFKEFLENNAHLLFRFAASGGTCCA